MKVGLVGSRTFTDKELAQRVILKLYKHEPNFIPISGGAKGADTICADFCRKILGRPPIIFPADWDKYGKSAGFRRNRTIVENSDALIAFWDGKSDGTADTIIHAEYKDIPVLIVRF